MWGRTLLLWSRTSLPKTLACYQNYSNHLISTPPEPPSPELCCMSGCANCVWIEYAKELKEYYGSSNEAVIDKALKKIEDPSFRLFISNEIKGQLSRPKK